MSDQHFYVQETRRGLWHVESDEHCEYMLCGLYISVDATSANIAVSPGSRQCADCWILLDMQHRIERLARHQQAPSPARSAWPEW